MDNQVTRLTARQEKMAEIRFLTADYNRAADAYTTACIYAEQAGKDPETDYNCNTLRGARNVLGTLVVLAQSELLLLQA